MSIRHPYNAVPVAHLLTNAETGWHTTAGQSNNPFTLENLVDPPPISENYPIRLTTNLAQQWTLNHHQESEHPETSAQHMRLQHGINRTSLAFVRGFQ